MKWIGDRVSFKDNKENISFVIYPPRLGKKRVVMLVWYALWLLIGGYVTLQFFKDYGQDEKIALFVFMAFWLYFAIRVLRAILYVDRKSTRLNSSHVRISYAVFCLKK